jgi:hypothetical protein
MKNSPVKTDVYKLRSIIYMGDSKITIKMNRNEDAIEVRCEVKRFEDSFIEGLDLISFESSRFDDLCIQGLIDLKLLRDAIFSFNRFI